MVVQLLPDVAIPHVAQSQEDREHSRRLMTLVVALRFRSVASLCFSWESDSVERRPHLARGHAAAVVAATRAASSLETVVADVASLSSMSRLVSFSTAKKKMKTEKATLASALRAIVESHPAPLPSWKMPQLLRLWKEEQ